MNFLITAQVQDNGHLPDASRLAIQKVLGNLVGKRCTIEIKVTKKKRSARQNAFYWGVVIPMVAGLFAHHGSAASQEFVHRYLKGEVAGMKKQVITPDGEVTWDVDTSTKLSTAEWEDYIETIRAWAAVYGLQIPLPKENMECLEV